MERNVDYRHYHFSGREWIIYGGGGLLFIGSLAFLFYGTGKAVVLLIPFLGLFLYQKRQELKLKQQQTLQYQFKDFLIALSSSLMTGYSIENAMRQAEEEMKKLYGTNGLITAEIIRMNREIHVNIPIEECLERCGARTGLKDIMLFSEVFRVAKQSGGDLVSIMKKTSGRIGEKIEVNREIETMISGKKTEHRLLCIAPIAMVGYLRLSSPGYLDGMYGNLTGIVFMTICLVFYFISWYLGERLVEIEH